VQRFVRKLPRTKEMELLKRIFRDSKGKDHLKGEYIKLEHKEDPLCEHKDRSCSCVISITGVHPILQGHFETIRKWNMEEDTRAWIARFTTSYRVEGGEILSQMPDSELGILQAYMTGTNVTLADPPINKCSYPAVPLAHHISPVVHEVVRNADMAYLRMKYGIKFSDKVYKMMFTPYTPQIINPLEVPMKSLVELTLQKHTTSMYQLAFGSTNGYPHYLASHKNLYPLKGVKTILKNMCNTHKPLPAAKHLEELLPLALEHLYTSLGTRSRIGKLNIPLVFDFAEDRNLANSAGLNPGREYVTNVMGDKIKISPNGNKYENHLADMKSVLEFIRDPTNDPAIFWQTSFKNEHIFHPGKNFTQEEWNAKMEKCRTFVCPSSLFSMMEILVGQRMKMERGRVIRVGQSWAHGGADIMAAILNIYTDVEANQPVLVEGDGTNFDQRVMAQFVEMYFSMGMIYDSPLNPDYEARVEITKFLIRNIICRLTHLFGPIWGIQRGGVPSGCQNTSHLDSWVMALWFFSLLYVSNKSGS